MRTLVYILGFSYSGSTLLALLLNAHPQIGTTGEIVGPPHFGHGRHFVCSCGKRIDACPFYRELGRRIAHPDFDLARCKWGTRVLSQPPSFPERLWLSPLTPRTVETIRDLCRCLWPEAITIISRRVELNRRFVMAACELLDTDMLVDSSKVPAQLPILTRIPGIRLKLVHLLRHPAGCVWSAMTHHGHPRRLAAKAWLKNLEICDASLARFGAGRYMRVRYEDLCESPDVVLRDLCAFLDVAYAPRMLRFRPAVHHVVGNRMRLTPEDRIRLDDAWRAALSPADLRVVARVTGRRAAEHGYGF
jgi:hypothetical protein